MKLEHRTQRDSRRSLLAGAGLAALFALGGCPAPGGGFTSIDITGADYGRDFELPDADGKVRTLADFRGKLVLLFFGYAQCPDVCPTALTRALEVRRAMGDDGQKVQVVFITVDPERDTPAVLKEYMAAFDPGFIALRGSPEQTAAVAREFRAVYMKVPTGSSYAVDHTAITYVFDTQGRLRLAVRHETGAEPMRADLQRLLARG